MKYLGSYKDRIFRSRNKAVSERCLMGQGTKINII